MLGEKGLFLGTQSDGMQRIAGGKNGLLGVAACRSRRIVLHIPPLYQIVQNHSHHRLKVGGVVGNGTWLRLAAKALFKNNFGVFDRGWAE
jgi:hypothetical protein